MSTALHVEKALFQAGASDGYYEIIGASYVPEKSGAPGTGTIDLSTVDHTGCLLIHDYGSEKTTLVWDSDIGTSLHGSDDDVETAIEDITGGSLDHKGLFAAFRTQMTASETVAG